MSAPIMQLVEFTNDTGIRGMSAGSTIKGRDWIRRDNAHADVHEVLGTDVHAKRVLSFANTTTDVLSGGSLTVAAIGQDMAHACSVRTRHTVEHHAQRWCIESHFSDTKDLRFGLGTDDLHTRNTARPLFHPRLIVYEPRPNPREDDLTRIPEAFVDALRSHRATSILFAAV